MTTDNTVLLDNVTALEAPVSESAKREARTLRDRVGHLEVTYSTMKTRAGTMATVEAPGEGPLGAAVQSIQAAIKASGGLGDQSQLEAAKAAMYAFYESIKDKLDIVPDRKGVSRKLAVGDLVVAAKNTPEAFKAAFGAFPRKVTSIDEVNGLVEVEGYDRPITRAGVVELSVSEIVAKRRPKGSAKQ